MITIDLHSQTITNGKTGEKENFDINSYKKECLTEGLDDIEYLLKNRESIDTYEKNNRKSWN